MMDRVLLVIPDKLMRQLYHGLFLSRHVDVLATTNIAEASIALATIKFTRIVIYAPKKDPEILLFLRVRSRDSVWTETHLSIITATPYYYSLTLESGDDIFDITHVRAPQIANMIMKRCGEVSTNQ